MFSKFVGFKYSCMWLLCFLVMQSEGRLHNGRGTYDNICSISEDDYLAKLYKNHMNNQPLPSYYHHSIYMNKHMNYFIAESLQSSNISTVENCYKRQDLDALSTRSLCPWQPCMSSDPGRYPQVHVILFKKLFLDIFTFLHHFKHLNYTFFLKLLLALYWVFFQNMIEAKCQRESSVDSVPKIFDCEPVYYPVPVLRRTQFYEHCIVSDSIRIKRYIYEPGWHNQAVGCTCALHRTSI